MLVVVARRPVILASLVCVCVGVCVGFAVAAAPAQAAASIGWHKAVRIEPSADDGVQAVSCPSDRLCVAVDGSGHVLFTTHPTRGAHSWSRPAQIDGGTPLTGVSCAGSSLCVAVDDGGRVLTSTRPTRGAKDWSRPVRIDAVRAPDGGYAGLLGVSCASTRLCVAVDGAPAGDVVATTNPLGGAGAWRRVRLGVTLTSVACASSGLCVVAGAEHLVSTDPSGGRGAWRNTGYPSDSGLLSAIDCPTTALCVGVGFSRGAPGLADATGDPRGRAAAWTNVTIAPAPPALGAGLLDAVGCAGRTLCVALDSADNAFVSTTPDRGRWSGPHLIRRNPASQQNALSCTTKLCVAVDSAGVEVTGLVHG
jgi:hypothetical protein